ncbi:hypothetical protein [Bradyrhizobium sp. RT4b]|uniref:hypothetical protein n=1 Tax=unclassified Bradyrhizobium TaxID=2631580 RepID=UPI00339589F9
MLRSSTASTFEGDGHELFEAAARLNYEGIVCKRPDAPYRSERNEAWLKIKTVQKGKFPTKTDAC